MAITEKRIKEIMKENGIYGEVEEFLDCVRDIFEEEAELTREEEPYAKQRIEACERANDIIYTISLSI